MFQLAADHIETTDMMSALASIETMVICNVIAPHQHQMAVDDIARTASEALGEMARSDGWRAKMN
jgi:hypothetical protein